MSGSPCRPLLRRRGEMSPPPAHTVLVLRRRDILLAAFAGCGFLALGLLLGTRPLPDADRYAVRHLMPWLRLSNEHLIRLATVVVPETRPSVAGTLVGLITYPASPFVSALIVAGCAFVIDRRGDRRTAVAVCALWVLVNLLELAGKIGFAHPRFGYAFTHTYPSGHTVRACVIVAALGCLSRPAAAAAAVWALLVAVALVLLGDHTPTDVVGGVLLASSLVPLLLRGRRGVCSRQHRP
jgi:membrane-associated phospholipid phosphatase